MRVYGTRRGTEWGYSLWSFRIVRRGRLLRISRHKSRPTVERKLTRTAGTCNASQPSRCVLDRNLFCSFSPSSPLSLRVPPRARLESSPRTPVCHRTRIRAKHRTGEPGGTLSPIGGGQPIFFTSNEVRIVDTRQQHSLWLMFVDGEARALDGEEPTGGPTVMRRLNATGSPALS